MIARFGDCAIDLDRLEVRSSGEVVAVEPQVFDVLSYLLEHRDRMVTKEELLDNVWGDRFVTESALTSRIKSARRALGDNGRDQRVIRTVHGRGYQFVAEVQLAERGTPAPRQAEPTIVHPPVTDAPGLDDNWPLVGRHDEIDEFDRLLHGCERHGVLLSGPAGIGKTRLARVCAERARHAGMSVIHLSGHRTAEQIPLGALAHLLPAEVLETDTSSGELARTIVFQRARAALVSAGAGGRLVMVVDHADHLDELSSALIGSLTASGDVFAILTQRTAGRDPLAFDELIRNEQIAHLELGPLSDTDLDVLLYRVLAGPIDLESLQQLTTLSRGRPGALQQLVETCRTTEALAREDGVWRLVGPIQAAVGIPGPDQLMLDTLPPAAVVAAELLAVAHELDLDLATSIVGADELDILDRAGLLSLQEVSGGPRVSIAHAHVAGLLEERLGPLRARRHRARLVAAMDPATITEHDRMRRIGWMLENGDTPDESEAMAAARFAVATAEGGVAELVLDHLAATEAANEAMQLRAELYFRRGQMNLADDLLARVDRTTLTAHTAATVVRRQATIRFHARGEFDDALALLDDAEGDFDGPARDLIVAHAIGLRGFLGHADRLLAQAATLPDDLAPAPTLEVLRGTAQALTARGEFTAALEVLDRHDDASRTLAEGAARAGREVSLATRIAIHTAAGDIRAATDAVRRHLPVGQRTMLAWLPMAAARAELMAGRPRVARALISTPLAAVRSMNLIHAEPQMTGILAQTSLRTGLNAEASAEIEQCLQALEPLTGQMRWSLLVSIADVAARIGLDADLGPELLGAADDARAAGARLPEAELLMAAAKIGAVDGVERIDRLADRIEGTLWRIRAAQARALAESDEHALREIEVTYRELGYDGYADGVASTLAVGRPTR